MRNLKPYQSACFGALYGTDFCSRKLPGRNHRLLSPSQRKEHRAIWTKYAWKWDFWTADNFNSFTGYMSSVSAATAFAAVAFLEDLSSLLHESSSKFPEKISFHHPQNLQKPRSVNIQSHFLLQDNTYIYITTGWSDTYLIGKVLIRTYVTKDAIKSTTSESQEKAIRRKTGFLGIEIDCDMGL